VDNGVVRVVLEPGESLQQDGNELNSDAGATLEFGPLEERGGINLASGATVIEVEIRFKLSGQALALTAFNGHAPGSLSVLFRDQTSGRTTHQANRSLSVVPVADGTVHLDFNRAVNPPCAYTDLATCPLPRAA
jgi:uncharacterized protein (DUF1684 family)